MTEREREKNHLHVLFSSEMWNGQRLQGKLNIHKSRLKSSTAIYKERVDAEMFMHYKEKKMSTFTDECQLKGQRIVRELMVTAGESQIQDY